MTRCLSTMRYKIPMYEYQPTTTYLRWKTRRNNWKRLEPVLGKNRTMPVAICVALIFAAMLFVGVANAETLYVCIDESSWLNGRAEPDKHSEATMRLYSGDELEFVSTNGNWIEVVGGETGTSYVDSRYVSETFEPYSATNNSGGRVKIRESIDGKVVGYVKAEKTVTISRTINGWGYIGKGWVLLSCFDY